MMRVSESDTSLPSNVNGGEKKWELRPGGMLVQKRMGADQNRVLPPTIRVRVKYNSIYHEIHISSQASFGELKKLLSGVTGLHHQDQKLFYKDKERDSKVFLDTVGVRDKSKIVLQQDPISQEKRILEMRKNAKSQKAAQTVSQVSLEVDKLARKVSALESLISKGQKVVEEDVVKLTELLMNQLLKLDGIVTDTDAKSQSKIQEKRVQKCIETLDMLKLKNSMRGNGKCAPLQQQQPKQKQMATEPRKQHRYSNGNESSPIQQNRYSNGSDSSSSPVDQLQSLANSPKQLQQQQSRESSSVVITTQWETFDSTPASILTVATSTNPAQPGFPWNLL